MQKTLKNSGACKHDHDFLSCFCIAMHLHYPCIVNFKSFLSWKKHLFHKSSKKTLT